ncbi:DUF397 domain-containing protein [Streptomyces sp. NPDC002181]|uniref:DUF397 domain-containing protein n=1 Tax=Streptomyces sp. NPDC002181 TaxID=3364635 RepID=UPI0036BBF03E
MIPKHGGAPHTKPDPADLELRAHLGEETVQRGNDNCVEFDAVGDLVAIRDSKRPKQTPLFYTRSEIAALLAGAKAGAFAHIT